MAVGPTWPTAVVTAVAVGHIGEIATDRLLGLTYFIRPWADRRLLHLLLPWFLMELVLPALLRRPRLFLMELRGCVALLMELRLSILRARTALFTVEVLLVELILAALLRTLLLGLGLSRCRRRPVLRLSPFSGTMRLFPLLLFSLPLFLPLAFGQGVSANAHAEQTNTCQLPDARLHAVPRGRIGRIDKTGKTGFGSSSLSACMGTVSAETCFLARK